MTYIFDMKIDVSEILPNDHKVYPQIIQRLNSTDGFIQAVYDVSKAFDTQLEAYEAVERIHERYFGKRRYEDYTHFIAGRSKFYKRARAKRKT